MYVFYELSFVKQNNGLITYSFELKKEKTTR